MGRVLRWLGIPVLTASLGVGTLAGISAPVESDGDRDWRAGFQALIDAGPRGAVEQALRRQISPGVASYFARLEGQLDLPLPTGEVESLTDLTQDALSQLAPEGVSSFQAMVPGAAVAKPLSANAGVGTTQPSSQNRRRRSGELIASILVEGPDGPQVVYQDTNWQMPVQEALTLQALHGVR